MNATRYIATWFYQESAEEASFYPQVGQRGNSRLAHSIYMQIQMPFFSTFRYYHPEAKLLFFTNAPVLPDYLERLFATLYIEVVRIAYQCAPPKGWYKAWCNQFYVYDIFRYMDKRMRDGDTLLVCDSDCLCRHSLQPLFQEIDTHGSALYELETTPSQVINGISLQQMEELYTDCYGERPAQPLSYYGGEFIALRGDTVKRVNEAYHPLWEYNLECFRHQQPKLNEEAHFFSMLAERLQLRNRIGNLYVKRMWTAPQYNNMEAGDEQLSVWHLPYEKKRGLFRIAQRLKDTIRIMDEGNFWHYAARETGIPQIGLGKRVRDRLSTLLMKLPPQWQ